MVHRPIDVRVEVTFPNLEEILNSALSVAKARRVATRDCQQRIVRRYEYTPDNLDLLSITARLRRKKH